MGSSGLDKNTLESRIMIWASSSSFSSFLTERRAIFHLTSQFKIVKIRWLKKKKEVIYRPYLYESLGQSTTSSP
jgi:hypothetical protein